MIEVELKAHLRDRTATLAAVASFAEAVGGVDKHDAYWHGPDWRSDRGERGFRVRREGDASVVTFKSKRTEGGIEVNHEREFAVSDEAAFAEFALRLGCEAFYGKRKTGVAFTASRATIEIIDVEGLGDFIEVEILLDDEDPEKIVQAKAELLGLLERAGVGESDIEPRFYSELLMEAGLVARP